LAAQQKNEEESDKPWFAQAKRGEDPPIEPVPTAPSSTQLIAYGGESDGEDDDSTALVPIPTAPQAQDKSFPLVATQTSLVAEKRVLTFDSTGNRVLAVVPSQSDSGNAPEKKRLTHAQKIAKKYEDDKRKEAQGLFDKKKGGGVENLPVKQNVTSYRQRLNNIMHMERNLDTLLGRGKPSFKDQRSDMAYDDLRKCGAGAAN